MNYSNNYKEIFIDKKMNYMKKRGQMTIFIIVAIALVVIILLFFLFRPQIGNILGNEISPNSYLEGCIEPEIKPAVNILSQQGSYQNPEGYISYKGSKVKYLCYTDDFYETCTVQQPMTKGNFEKELNLMVKAKANKCVRNLIEEYEKRGYEVTSGGIDSSASIVPGKIIVSFNAPMTVTKQTSEKYQSFDVEIESQMYDLLFIATSLVQNEVKVGDSATELYLQYYPDLKIEKTKLTDGTKIYKLTNVVTEEQFTFASRSLSWPAGYGLEENK
ncbi:MAG: hypothetical protein Q7S27_06975 [Nanoarchaeota archaeon]|nr:hypothetical protein [Nanoarchaeota archaeon]